MILKNKRGKKNKKAAMEMSVGTIVTIVILMSVLILGLILVKDIFSTGKKVVDMTDQQLTSEINKLFGENKEVVIYPSSRLLKIKQDETDGFGIGIRNLLSGGGIKKFSYEVYVSDQDIKRKCGVSEKEAEGWIVTGRAEKNIPIPSGSISSQKVVFKIPKGSPLCTFRLRINVDADGTPYGTDFVDLEIIS